jgi:predicted Holliday junction resolvase-like endonuclease
MLVIAIMLLAVVLAVGVAGLILYVKDLRTRLSNATAELKDAADQLERRTKKAVTSSRTGHVGRIVEQLAPLLPGFPEYNLKDVQWVGGTTDFIVWKGLEDATCQRFPADAQVEIIFMDVKSGNAGLSARQRLIRNAIDANRVYFRTHRFRPDDTAITSDEDLNLTDEDLELV